MAINQAVDRSAMGAAQAQLARVDSDGCVDHSYRRALLSAAGPAANRDLADAVHLFCSLYGRYPGAVPNGPRYHPRALVWSGFARKENDGFVTPLLRFACDIHPC